MDKREPLPYWVEDIQAGHQSLCGNAGLSVGFVVRWLIITHGPRIFSVIEM